MVFGRHHILESEIVLRFRVFGYSYIHIFEPIFRRSIFVIYLRIEKKRRILRIRKNGILREKSWISTNVSFYPLENEIILWFVVFGSIFFRLFVIKINIS